MGWFSRLLNQKITYWATSGTDDFGNANFQDPVTLNARWENKNELFRDKTGNEAVSKAVVYLNQDIALTGYIALEEIDDWSSGIADDEDTVVGNGDTVVGSSSGSAADLISLLLDIGPEHSSVTNSYEIRGFDKTPSIKAGQFVRKVWL